MPLSLTVTRIAPVGRSSAAWGLNDSGVVVGEVDGTSPWMFSPPGRGIQLQTLPTGGGVGRASRINNNGAIVGDVPAPVELTG